MTGRRGLVADESPRLLVLVAGDQDRTLLADRLGDEFDVHIATPDDDWGTFDCCLVDDRTISTVIDALTARRAAADPVFLPVVLLARDQRRADAALAGSMAATIDDVVVLPTSSRLLGARVASLVRTRRLSLRLDDEREQYRALTESAQDAIVVFDERRRIRFLNPAVESMFGYDPDDCLGNPVAELLPRTAITSPGEDPLDVAADGGVFTARHADGHEFPVELSVAPFGHNGERRYTAFVRDVTEREARMAALVEERAVLKGIFEATPDVMMTFDRDGTLDRWNDRLPTVSGYTDAELAELSPSELIREGDHAVTDAALRAALENQATARVEARLVTRDGSEIPLDVAVAPLVGDHGETRGAVAAGRDVTARVERERELKRSRELLEETQSIAHVGGWEMDATTLQASGTDETYRIHDLPVGGELPFEEIIGSYHPDDADRAREALQRTLSTGESFDLELRRLADDGVYWLRVKGGRVDGDDGPVVRGTVQDITEQVERTLELERTERRFRAVFEGANEAMVIANDDGEYVDVNPAATELFGLDEAELCGRTIADFAPPDYDFDGEWARFRQGKTVTGEFPLVRPDGTRLSTRFSATPNILPGKHLSVLRDVTDRKRRERDLERYETIVQAAADPIYALDEDGHITLANDALAAAMGRSVDDLLGTTLEELLDSVGVDASREQLAALAAGDDPEPMALTLSTPEGRRQYEVNIARHGDREAGSDGTVGVARDVTDVVSRERRLSVLDRVLRHNIRNKLNVVLGHAEMLTGDASATVRASGVAIVDACEELLALSETARRFETAIRPDATAQQSLDLTTHLPHVVEEMTATHDVTVSLDLDRSLIVEAHEALEIALEEVVENAIVHCDREPQVSVTAHDCPDEGVVEVRVADNGPGIATVDRAALDKGAETPLEHMSGLGLWFVRWTAESSGGTLTIEANEPRGTVVVLRLPRAAAE